MASGTMKSNTYRLVGSKTGTAPFSFTSTNYSELCVFVNATNQIQSGINIPIERLTSSTQYYYVGWGDTTGGFVGVFTISKSGDTITGALYIAKVNGTDYTTAARIDIYAR